MRRCAGLAGIRRCVVTVLVGLTFALESSCALATLRLTPIVPQVTEDYAMLPEMQEVVVVAFRPDVYVRDERALRTVLRV
eukprot:4567285-Pleurochrysis_carterae.AAC.1